MTAELLMDVVKQIIADQMHISESDISEDAAIMDELGASSLDVVEMLMSLEEATGVTVPDEDIEQLKTPADTVHYLESTGL